MVVTKHAVIQAATPHKILENLMVVIKPFLDLHPLARAKILQRRVIIIRCARLQSHTISVGIQMEAVPGQDLKVKVAQDTTELSLAITTEGVQELGRPVLAIISLLVTNRIIYQCTA